jgi:hypothetical protein
VVLHWVMQAGRWDLGPKPKIERRVLGCGYAVGNGSQGRWGDVVGWCVQGGGGGVVVLRCVTLAGRWDLGLKPKIECQVLGYRYAMGNGCWKQWGEVVGWCIQGGGGVVMLHSVMQAGVAGFEARVQNQAAGAWLRACRWEWQSGAMGGSGRVVHTR